MGSISFTRKALWFLLVVVLCTLAVPAQPPPLPTVATGTQPFAVAVNPVTNTIYVANNSSGTVTAINGATDATTTITVGTNPVAIAVNPQSNQAWVVNSGSNNVSLISSNNAVTAVAVGNNPQGVAVNPADGMAYVTNNSDNTVSVINSFGTVVATVPTGAGPAAVAVDPGNNTVYICNLSGNSVTVIDGSNNTVLTTITVGTSPRAVAVGPGGYIYVANFGDGSVSELFDGNKFDVYLSTTVSVGSNPVALVVNPVTGLVYVACRGSNNVAVINGSTVTATVNTGTAPQSVAVNVTTNQIYVANFYSANVTVIDGATNTASTLNAGTTPLALAVNPITNKAYVANANSNNVTVIDGAKFSITLVNAGSFPGSLDVNLVTNTIYVVNGGDNTVSVINGATNAVTATVPTGTQPYALAVNSVTNKVYVANYSSNNVTVIDGATNNTTTVSTGMEPFAIAVNPVTNKIYVANYNSNTVTVIDGVTNNTTTVNVGNNPDSIAINPTINKIYVATPNSGAISIINGDNNTASTLNVGTNPLYLAMMNDVLYVTDGANSNIYVINTFSNAITATLTAGNTPYAIAVNAVTAKIYVANFGDNTATVIDGSTNTTTTVPTGPFPDAIAVNPVSNKIYVPNANVSNAGITVIDGATNFVTNLTVGTSLGHAVVNPVTDTIYVSNAPDGNVVVITEASAQVGPTAPSITPFPSNSATTTTPTFTFTIPSNTPAIRVYYQTDTTEGVWTAAHPFQPSALTTIAPLFSPLKIGQHVVYAFSGDAQDATSTQIGSPITSNIAAYWFTVNPVNNSTIVITGGTPQSTALGTVFATPLQVTITDVFGGPVPGASVTFTAPSSGPSGTFGLGATSTAVVFTDVNGIATAPTVTANNSAGPFTLTAKETGNGLLRNFLLTNIGPPPGASVTNVLAAGSLPFAAAVNPLTNKVYVANQNSANVTVIDGATNSTTTVGVGNNPVSVAVNPVSNKIYVANQNDNTVTVIDGATNTTLTVNVGFSPNAVAVNPATNKIYVANQGNGGNIAGNVTVIDGATNSTATLNVGGQPFALAVNPVTNKIFVSNQGNSTVNVIDGATNSISASLSMAAGSQLSAVAVNPVTNKIYVIDANNGIVNVIDGATYATTAVNVGFDPLAVAVNPVTNKIYVGCFFNSNSIVVIDGATNNVTSVGNGNSALSIAVNPVTNKIYFGNGFSPAGESITVLDGATNAVTVVKTTGTLVSGSAANSNVVVNPVTNKIYATNPNPNTITVLDGAINSTATVSAGSLPSMAAVNPVTNKIYIANDVSSNVTVIDGATNATVTVPAGTNPARVAVNQVTNKVYVTNVGNNSVTVIDGASNSTLTVSTGIQPFAIAVNPVTNKIYAANVVSSSVTVIDGATNNTTTILVGSGPEWVAVNPVTNTIYVANNGGTVSVINGANNTVTATVTTGNNPMFLAVNVATNKIYVSNSASNTVTVIDGATNNTTTVNVGNSPQQVAVNPVTNQIYVANRSGNSVTVINGATNQTTTISGIVAPYGVSVNVTSNKIYVSGTFVTVIDGATNSIATVTAGNNPALLAVNPVTNKVYVPNRNDGTVTVITEESVQQTLPPPVIGPLPSNLSLTATPSFAFTAPSGALDVRYQLDTWQGPWLSSAPFFNTTTPALQPGPHILYAFAIDGQAGSSTQVDSLLTGTIAAYSFIVDPTGAITATAGSLQFAGIGVSFATPLQATVTDNFGQPLAGVAVTFSAPTGGASGDFGPPASTTATVTTNSVGLAIAPPFTANTTPGSYTVNASVAGVATPASFALTNSALNVTPAITTINPGFVTAGTGSTFVLVQGSGFQNGAVVEWNGSPRSTTFSSSTMLGTYFAAADLATAGVFPVTVANPAPSFGPSAPVNFTVNNAAPALSALSITSVPGGTAGFLLTVTGSGFVSGATGMVNGSGRSTVVGSSTSLGMFLTTADLTTPGTLAITVANPAPTVGPSSALTLMVTSGNLVPGILALTPGTVPAGSGSFTLTVLGSNFVPTSQVLWNGSPRASSYASPQQINATITGADVANPATAAVTVFNPAPGGGTSPGMNFTVGSGPQGSVTAQSVSGGGTSPVSVPVTLTLNNGATATALIFGVRIIPGTGAPAITANLNFVPDSALPVASGTPPTIAASPASVAVFFGAFTTPLSGTVTLGVVQVTLPAGVALGQTYDVQITAADAAANNATVPLTAGPDATITIAQTYLVGDSFPYTGDMIGSFGDGLINTLDLIEALRAVTKIEVVQTCSDRFDAIDSYPVDTATTRGGDAILNTLDIIETLRRAVNIDTSRPARTSRGLSCTGTEVQARRGEPRQSGDAPVEGRIVVERDAIYLVAQADLNLAGLALALNLQPGQQANFTPGDVAASLTDVALAGKISLAWLDGIRLGAGQRLLLGSVNGADRGSVLGISADEVGGRAVRIVAEDALNRR